jgi:hypothetical protein
VPVDAAQPLVAVRRPRAAGEALEVWTPNATTFSIKLVTWTGGSPGPEFQYNLSGLAQGQWNSVNIPMSAFTGVNTTSIGQLLWANNTPMPENGTFFLDNIYFFQ